MDENNNDNNGSGSTQLADPRPQLDTPLRVAIPVNAPPRMSKVKRDSYIYTNAFSPAAIFNSKSRMSTLLREESGHLLEHKANTNISINMDHDALMKTAVKDFSVLAQSSKRAERKDVEATAYASLGVIHDNQSNYIQAIESYKSYFQVCEEISDSIGSACACNCIGVNYMLLAFPPSDSGSMQQHLPSQQSKEYLNKAIFYHSKHLDIGPDAGGHFVAHTNLGLCVGMLGDYSSAAKNHQDALRIAIKMQTLYGQSIAVGNLGNLALLKGDFATAKTCFDQHLQLVQALQDPEAEIVAWKLLANLASSEERHFDALESLEEAKKIAEKNSFFNELRRVHCMIGVAKGTLEFTNVADSILNMI